MKMKVYSVHDQKAEAFLQPFFVQSRGLAVRSFSDAVNDEKHHFNKHLEDYILFELGEYDDATGLFTQDNPPKALFRATDMVIK